MHSDQWRYDRPFEEICPTSQKDHRMTHGHTADLNALAVRNGWLPCYPQFNKSIPEVVGEARAAGATDDAKLK